MDEPCGDIRDIQARVGGLFCRVCGRAKFDLVLRCDRYAERCAFVGRCERCGWQSPLPERQQGAPVAAGSCDTAGEGRPRQ